MQSILDFLNANSGVAIFTSMATALISTAALCFSIYYNAKTQKQYKKAIEPQLS